MNRSKTTIVNGVEYESKQQALNAYGANSIVVYNYMQKHNCSLEQAIIACTDEQRIKEIQRIKDRKNNKYKVFNNSFKTLTDICRYYSLDYTKFYYIYSKIDTKYWGPNDRYTKIEMVISYMLMCNKLGEKI